MSGSWIEKAITAKIELALITNKLNSTYSSKSMPKYEILLESKQ